MAKKEPLVSVIMPAYNAGKFIAKSIKSILNQTYLNIELIIVDGNSSDNTLEIIKRFEKIDKRVKPIFLKVKRRTIAEVRNIAISKAKGRFYATADADDISVPSRIKKQVRFMEKHNCQISGTWYTKTKTPETGKEGVIQYQTWLPEDIENELHLRNTLGGPSNMLRADAFHRLGGYNEDLMIGEDCDLHIKAIKNGMKIMVVPEVLVRYRMNPASITHNVPPTPWKNPLNLASAWDTKISSFLFNVPLNKLYDAQIKWINDKLIKFIGSKKVLVWKGPREGIFVTHFINWAVKRKVKIAGIFGSNPYCGIKPIKLEDLKGYLKNGYKVVICEGGKTRVEAAMLLESFGAKVWKDYICAVPYLTRLAEIEAAKKIQKYKYNL